MPLYFYVHDAKRFHDQLRPALSACWLRRSFAPIQNLATSLLDEAKQSFPHGGELFLAQVVVKLAFDRDLWRLLVGEVLLYAAVEVPEIPTTPTSWKLLLLDEQRVDQIHFGSRDLHLGGVYRPDNVGWNDADDVKPLCQWLQTIRSDEWRSDMLLSMTNGDDEEAAEELLAAKESLTAMTDLYQRTAERQRLIICERL